MKLSQRQRVERDLNKRGYVSRNKYLDLPFDKILRLSSIIQRLRILGMNIRTDITQRDTIYRLK